MSDVALVPHGNALPPGPAQDAVIKGITGEIADKGFVVANAVVYESERIAGGGRFAIKMLTHEAAQDEENGAGMTDKQVRDEAMTIFLAGHETTANALTWTWHLLSRHPQM